MHIIVSSHHLEEVERICDGVVIVEGGEVVHAGTLADVRRGPEGLLVEVDGRADELASILTGARLRRDRRGRRAPARRRGRRPRSRSRRRRRPRGGAAAARVARTDAGGRVPGGRHVTTGQDAQLFDLGYRRYDGPRERPARAIPTLAVFTMRRVLGLGRGGRHKVLPAITLAIAYLPALVSVAVAAIVDVVEPDRSDLLRRLHVLHRQRARALRGARRSRGALPGPAHGNARALSRRAARPQPLSPRQGARRPRGHAPDHRRPAALHARRLRARRLRTECRRHPAASASHPCRRARDGAALRIPVDGRLELHDPTSGGCGECHPPAGRAGRRRRTAIESADAPDALDLLSFPFVAADLAYRIFGEQPDDNAPIESLSTWAVAGGLGAAIVAGAFVCWFRYRRIEGFR